MCQIFTKQTHTGVLIKAYFCENVWYTHVSFTAMFILYSSLAPSHHHWEKKDRKNLNIIMYMNSTEKNQQRCCVQSMNGESLRGYRVSFSLYLFHWLGRAYIRSIHSSTEGIGWHSIADGINIKILYTFLHVYISGWLCKLLLLSVSLPASQIESFHY